MTGGTLGSFLDANTTLVDLRANPGSDVVGDRLYVFGGSNVGPGGAQLSSMESAIIRSDGTLEAFRPAGAALAVGHDGPDSIAVGNYIYVVGGDNDIVERLPLR